MWGEGLAKGLAVTLRNAVGSFVDPARLATVQYPEAGNTVQHASRNFPILIYDGPDPVAGMRCVACRICEKECPPQCILIEIERDAAGKPMKRPGVFDVDYSVCMSCQICVEVCPFDAIEMDSAFEFSTGDRFGGLLKRRDELLRSTEYWESINPEGARPVDEKVQAQIEKKKSETGAASAPGPSGGGATA